MYAVLVLAVACATTFLGVRLVVAKISKPLKRLEELITRYPEETPPAAFEAVAGRREVTTLSRGKADIAYRLASLERERLTTRNGMVHAERLVALGPLTAVSIAVEDNGPGVTPSLRTRIFEPFFSTKPAGKGKGIGLGLAVSAQLISDLGGTLGLSPTPSPLGGASFVIRIPGARLV